LQMAALKPACAARGIALEDRIWNDPGFDAGAYDAVIVGTPWDYMEQPQAFLAALARFAALRPLFNPLPVIRWNLDKGYLKDLAAAGAVPIPPIWADRAGPAGIAAAFDALGADTLVVKPRVGAGAWRQARVRRGEPLPPPEALPPGAAMIQPYLS